MRIEQLDGDALATRLSNEGLTASVGPFSVRFRSPLPAVAGYISSHYGAFPVLDQDGCHMAIDIDEARGIRTFIRRQAVFRADGMEPFFPLPQDKAPALLEWGFNWCIGRRIHHLVVVHSAVVARDGRAALLPAPPESGKSTLCAALVAHGCRLCSDEFALVDPVTSRIFPLPHDRPPLEPSRGEPGRRESMYRRRASGPAPSSFPPPLPPTVRSGHG